MPDPLDIIWRCADQPRPVFSADDVAEWPEGHFEILRNARLVKEAEPARHVVCDNCAERHAAEVWSEERPDGPTRFFYACPEAGRMEIAEDRLAQWMIDFNAAAVHVAQALGTGRSPAVVIPDYLWRLGAANCGQRRRLAFLGRRLADLSADAKSNLTTGALLLVPLAAPAAPLNNATMVLILADVASWTGSGIHIELPPEPEPETYVFRREGAAWRVACEGNAVWVKHSIGMEYIAYLLARPNETIAAAVLRAETYAVEGTLSPGQRDELMSIEGRARCQQRLADIEAERRDAEKNNDAAALDRLERDRDAIVAEMRKADGLGGRPRLTPDDAEKARISVTTAITRALAAVKAEHEPCWHHLSNAIRTGADCCYRPDRDINWNLS